MQAKPFRLTLHNLKVTPYTSPLVSVKGGSFLCGISRETVSRGHRQADRPYTMRVLSMRKYEIPNHILSLVKTYLHTCQSAAESW